MKPAHLTLLLFVLYFISCNSTEHGTLEHSSLSKKVFDSFKSDDSDKFKQLLPDKVSYKKYLNLNAKSSTDWEDAYKEFEQIAISGFTDFRKGIEGWEQAIHANYTEVTSKQNNVTSSTITTKLTINNSVVKYSFTAIKINSRWYCVGDFKLLNPETTTGV